MKENKIQIFIQILMEHELKIICTCLQAKIAICCQTSLVAPIAQKIAQGAFQHTESKFSYQIFSLTTPGIQALIW